MATRIQACEKVDEDEEGEDEERVHSPDVEIIGLIKGKSVLLKQGCLLFLKRRKGFPYSLQLFLGTLFLML